jgi:hypothetical protein
MRQVITRSILLLIGVCLFMVFSGISSRACDKNQLVKYVINPKKSTQIRNSEQNSPTEFTDFIFTNSLLRF